MGTALSKYVTTIGSNDVNEPFSDVGSQNI